MIDILITFALLASAITANKILLYSFSPELLVTIRMISAGLILLIVSNYSYKNHTIFSWKKYISTLKTIIIIALSTTFVNSLLKSYALKFMLSSKAAFFGTLDPFVTAIFAYFFFNEKLTVKKILGIICACAGSLILLADHAPPEEQFKAFAFISYPELAALGAIVISRFGWILAQRLLKQEVYTPLEINIQTMLLGGLFSLIFALSTNSYSIDIPNNTHIKLFALFSNSSISIITSTIIIVALALIYTILIGNVLAYNLYAHMLKKYSATYLSLLGFSVPLFVALYGKLLLGESLSLNFFISVAITFIGFMLFYSQEKL